MENPSEDRQQATEPRKLSREARRQQLIEATIETIATHGYSRTTTGNVAREAGLSHGLVNFHFESKEMLLTETLRFLAEEYRLNWTLALAAAGETPAEQLDAILRADFNPEICTGPRVSAWCAFWGEAQSRPLYQEQCGANDAEYKRTLETICARMAAEYGPKMPAERIARVLRVVSEGVWLDMITVGAPCDLQEAMRTVFACAAAFFPERFDEDGLKRGG